MAGAGMEGIKVGDIRLAVRTEGDETPVVLPLGFPELAYS